MYILDGSLIYYRLVYVSIVTFITFGVPNLSPLSFVHSDICDDTLLRCLKMPLFVIWHHTRIYLLLWVGWGGCFYRCVSFLFFGIGKSGEEPVSLFLRMLRAATPLGDRNPPTSPLREIEREERRTRWNSSFKIFLTVIIFIMISIVLWEGRGCGAVSGTWVCTCWR